MLFRSNAHDFFIAHRIAGSAIARGGGSQDAEEKLMIATSSGSRLRLRLSPAAEAAVRQGHPWVYADRVKDQNRTGICGEIAVLYDRRDRFLGLGLYDPGSVLRVRMLHTGNQVMLDDLWWHARLDTALERRRGLFGPETNGWRWINGESDGWPGLILDRYAETLVLKIYSAVWLPRLAEIEALIRSALQPRTLVLRLSRNLMRSAREEFGIEEGFRGDPGEETVVFLENGLRFEAGVRHGQKTGFFLDQRGNRRRAQALAEGRDVLNVFSFNGSFSLYAARGGAESMTDVDISGHALESAKRNFALNPDLAGVPYESVQADAFPWLEERQTGKKYGLVITDPPSLAKRETERAGAIQAYGRLAAAALRQTDPRGGVLVAASCSAHVSEPEFFQAVRRAAAQHTREYEELWTSGHAPDHPALFPEAHYLKAIALRVLS